MSNNAGTEWTVQFRGISLAALYNYIGRAHNRNSSPPRAIDSGLLEQLLILIIQTVYFHNSLCMPPVIVFASHFHKMKTYLLQLSFLAYQVATTVAAIFSIRTG